MEFVTFGTAELAKRNGFDVPTMFLWATNLRAGDDFLRVDSIGAMQQLGLDLVEENHNHGFYSYPRISMPTLAEFQAWFISKGLYVCPELQWYRDVEIGWYVAIEEVSTIKLLWDSGDSFRTYEQAMDYGLQKAFEYLK